MKIRVLSDLHLEHDEPLAIPYAEADLVVLAGDIHNHAEGLRWAAENFGSDVPVVYVPGNHEYYDGEFGALETAMQDAARSLPNVHFLNNTALTDRYGKWRVLGTTLWTDFALFGASDEALRESIAAAERVMVDFRGVIQVAWPEPEDEPRSFSPGDSLALHGQARAWLEDEAGKTFRRQDDCRHASRAAETKPGRKVRDGPGIGGFCERSTLARARAGCAVDSRAHAYRVRLFRRRNARDL